MLLIYLLPATKGPELLFSCTRPVAVRRRTRRAGMKDPPDAGIDTHRHRDAGETFLGECSHAYQHLRFKDPQVLADTRVASTVNQAISEAGNLSGVRLRPLSSIQTRGQ